MRVPRLRRKKARRDGHGQQPQPSAANAEIAGNFAHFAIITLTMRDVQVGVIGPGNVGSGALAILSANAEQIALKLGFRLRVAAVCSRSMFSKAPDGLPDDALRTADW